MKADAPFHHASTEEAVVGLMMQSQQHRRTVLGAGLSSDHFVAYRAVFDAIAELERGDQDFDFRSVSAHLQRATSVDSEAVAAVERIGLMPVGAEHLNGWIESLREASVVRIAQDSSAWLGKVTTAGDALEAARQSLEVMQEAASGPTLSTDGPHAVARFLQRWNQQRKSEEPPGLLTGLSEIDDKSGGMRPADLWVVLGKSSRGKSVLMSQMACPSIVAQKRVAYFTLEMALHVIMGRLFSHVGKIHMGEIMNPNRAISKDLQIRIIRAQNLLQSPNFFVNDSANISISYIEAESLRLRDAHGGLDLIVVDYLQIVDATVTRNSNREQLVSQVSKRLKQLAKKLDCPVLTASQLNDKGEARESAGITHNADVMIFIADDGLRVGKLRNGERDFSLPYLLDGAYQTFYRENRT